jgi:hypothetical protein
MTEIGRCRDCRWWSGSAYADQPVEPGEWGDCRLIRLSDAPLPARSYGDFVTKAEFGCVLFEADQ